MVKIRLQRFGTKKRPFYRLVVADSTCRRNGRFIERVGFYDPINIKEPYRLNEERLKYWIGCGAVPTDTTRSILVKTGMLQKQS